MKEIYKSGNLGRIYYTLTEDIDLKFKFRPYGRTYGIWWDPARGFYDGSYSDSDGGLATPVLPRHPSQLMGHPIHMHADRVFGMPDRIAAVGANPSYCGFYSDRFLEGLEEIGISVPYQEVEYGGPLDPFTAEERAMLGRRYYVIKFEQTEVDRRENELHLAHYYGEADLFVIEDGIEAFTHPVMAMVHRKKLTGFQDAHYCLRVRSLYRPQMPPQPSHVDDPEGIKRWYKELEEKRADYLALPDVPFKDKRWPGKRIDYMLANGYRL